MKKLSIVVCLIAALAVTVSVARAAVIVNDKSDFTLLVSIPCANGGAGEDVLLQGTLHTLFTFTINGNNVSGKSHFQPQGVSGVGLTTGATYRATGVTQDHFKTSLQNEQANLTGVNNFRIIGQGPGNNFIVHDNFHFTINANGDLTVSHDNFTTDCK